jgi:diguanylate cyclase (GGDEF)-like protein
MDSPAAGRSRKRWAFPQRRRAADRGPHLGGGDASADPLHVRLQHTRRIGALGALVLLAILICAGFVQQQARQRDDRLEAERRAALQTTIVSFRSGLADLAQSRAAELVAAPFGDPSGRLAPAGPLRYEQAFLIDRAGNLIAAFPPGDTAIPAAVTRLVALYRQAGDAAVVSDVMLVDDAPAMIAIAALGSAAAGGPAGLPVLAVVARLDPKLIGAFEQMAGVKQLRFGAEPAAGGSSVQSLVDRDGRILGWFNWEQDRPMTQAVTQLLPLIILIAVALLSLAVMSVRQVRQTTQALAESETRVRRLAHEDTLTGLPNYRKMLDLADAALANRAQGQVVTFAYLDLDGFKEINDTFGHQGGDHLLAAFAERLQKVLPPGVAGGRFGGDEFAVVMTTNGADEGVEAAQAVLEAVSKPYWLDSRVVEVGCSIGLAQVSRDAVERDELTRRADLALRAAKRMGRRLLICFDPAMDTEFEDERFFKRELQRALADDGMEVHYQPIVAADGSRILGVEALLRWTHPTRGIIPPAVFIPVAEQTGLMEELGVFVLRRALGDALRWPDLYVAVNLSPVQVRNPAIVDRVRAELARAGIEPQRLVLEITEGVLMENPEEAKKRLEDLRALGVRVALDDFGSGYSSLAYLQRFTFDKLKIDRGFVLPLGRSANGSVIIQAIIALGRALGVTVLVEGVETEAQRVLLRLAGCDQMQGFLFAKPAPRETIDRIWAEANLQSARKRQVLRAGA